VDGLGGVRRGLAAALLALLVMGSTACGGGGGEAEQSDDSREDSSEDSGGAPGEDGDGGDDEATGDDDEGAPGEDAGDDPEAGDGAGDNDAATGTADDAQAAYVAYQQMLERLVIAPDPDDPEIAERSTGAAQDDVVELLGGYDGSGQAVEFGTRHEHHVYDVAVDGDTATVVDCFVSDARVVDESSRRIVRGDPEGGSASVVTATLVLDGDDWKVERIEAMAVEPPQSCGPDGVTRRGT
jgi:hypothetical protein